MKRRDYTNWHPDNIPVAMVWARCAHHPLNALTSWVMFPGGRVAVWHSNGWREEGVGAYTSDAYFRQVLTCDRPSCNYRAEMAPVSNKLVKQLLGALADATGYRAERDPSKTPAVVIEMNEFLRNPEPTLGSVVRPTE